MTEPSFAILAGVCVCEYMCVCACVTAELCPVSQGLAAITQRKAHAGEAKSLSFFARPQVARTRIKETWA